MIRYWLCKWLQEFRSEYARQVSSAQINRDLIDAGFTEVSPGRWERRQ
jgi:hypothetical protein